VARLIRTSGVRRRRNPSAQTAIAGALATRASIGADRISPICAPVSPCAANQTGM